MTLERLTFTTDLGDFAEVDLSVEAVSENEQIKLDIFTMLDKVITSPDAILASNTSSIPIMKLGMATSRPEKVVGIHFFNPVPVLNLVELVTSLLTAAETAERAASFATQTLGKPGGPLARPGRLVVNALLVPYILSAIRMMDSGVASADDIDQGNGARLRTPHGPARLGGPDRSGRDQGHCGLHVRGIQGAAVLRPAAAAAHGRSRPVRQKSGRGFFDHET